MGHPAPQKFIDLINQIQVTSEREAKDALVILEWVSHRLQDKIYELLYVEPTCSSCGALESETE